MVLQQDIKNAGIGLQSELRYRIGEKFLSQINTTRFDKEVEAGAKGFRRWFLTNNRFNGVEHLECLFMERRFGEMGHEIEEEPFMELAGFKGHLMEDGINSIELPIKRELV